MEPTQEEFAAAAESAANPAAQAPLSSWLLVSAGQGHGAQAVLPTWAAAAAAANHPLASAAGYSAAGLPGVIDLQQAATLLSHQQHQAAAVLAARQQQEQIAAQILAQNQDVHIAALLARHQQQAQEAAIAEAYQQRQRLVDAAKFLEHDRRVAESRVPSARSREHAREESDVAAVRRSEEEAFLAEREAEEHRYRQELRSESLHSARSAQRRTSSSSSSTSAEIVEVRKSSEGKRKLPYEQKYELERVERYKHEPHAEVSRKKSRYYESVDIPDRKHGRTHSAPQSTSVPVTASHHRHAGVPPNSYVRAATPSQVEELVDILTNEKEFDSKNFKPAITFTYNQVKDICIRVQTTFSKLLSAKATPPKSQRKERELKTVVEYQKREISGLKKTLQMMKARRESEKNTYKEHLRQSHLSSEEALRAYMRSSVHALHAMKRSLKSKKSEVFTVTPSES